jgi:hypothetical protein
MLAVSSPDQASEPEDRSSDAEASRRASVPGAVQAAAILLYIGGALTVLFALTGLTSASLGRLLWTGAYVLFGLLYLGLARAVQRGRRWARRVVLVLCGVGVVLAGIRLFGSGASSAVGTLAWPVVYAILLNTDTARSWFRSGGLETAR